ncbi:MAG: Calcineurin-like phosphoesterase [Mucilaginibacter sp.]|nr:Calcineurin-like phosphoesterase [Mucilaginibacter sp.]
MVHSKKYLFCVIISALFLSLVFAGHCYAQSGQCLIVSDLHFNPFFDGKHNIDTNLRNELTTSDTLEWERLLGDHIAANPLDSNSRGYDSNFYLLRSAIDAMGAKVPHPAFIVIAGDFIWHAWYRKERSNDTVLFDKNIPGQEQTLKTKSIQFIAYLFHKKFPGVPVIPALGNNDSDNGDYTVGSTGFLNSFATAWKLNKPGEITADLSRFDTAGYYTAARGNLKFVVLNSTLVKRGAVQFHSRGINMMQWLGTELSGSKNVWIISHIPPGKNGFDGGDMWDTSNGNPLNMFIDSITKHPDVVKLIIASHTHFNDFKVITTKNNTPVTYMRIVPSIGMDHRNNPSFEVADFDNAGRIAEETTFYLNIPDTNTKYSA